MLVENVASFFFLCCHLLKPELLESINKLEEVDKPGRCSGEVSWSIVQDVSHGMLVSCNAMLCKCSVLLASKIEDALVQQNERCERPEICGDLSLDRFQYWQICTVRNPAHTVRHNQRFTVYSHASCILYREVHGQRESCPSSDRYGATPLLLTANNDPSNWIFSFPFFRLQHGRAAAAAAAAVPYSVAAASQRCATNTIYYYDANPLKIRTSFNDRCHGQRSSSHHHVYQQHSIDAGKNESH
jgi:hypothetical protein